MDARGVEDDDVINAILTATSATWQSDHQTWLAGGLDRDGDDLRVAVEVEADVIVVTVM